MGGLGQGEALSSISTTTPASSSNRNGLKGPKNATTVIHVQVQLRCAIYEFLYRCNTTMCAFEDGKGTMRPIITNNKDCEILMMVGCGHTIHLPPPLSKPYSATNSNYSTR